MKTMKFNVGDKVRVKSLKWYNENKNISEEIIAKEGKEFGVFHPYMHSWCGNVLKIEKVKNGYYYAVTNGWRWYDWMLEDEVVKEEKQEIEQLNKNDMETKETKEMTQEEVLEYLRDTKILCASTEETIKIQEKLFTFGIEWISKSKDVSEDKYLLFINKKLKLQHTSDISFWMDDVNKRIEPSEILAIQIKEEKPKFDPHTLRVFDKILVRCGTNEKWRARFFDSYDNGYITANDSIFEYGVPYNEETKHLHGTTEDAPEFYRI